MSVTVTNPDAVAAHARLAPPLGQRAARVPAPAVARDRRSGATAGAPAVRCTAVPLDARPGRSPRARAAPWSSTSTSARPDDFDRFGTGGLRLALFSNALPALAHREGGRWRLDRYFDSGEAWTYPAADFAVRLRPPPGVDVAAPGVRRADGFRAPLPRPRLLVGRRDAAAPAAGARGGRRRHGVGVTPEAAGSAADQRPPAAGRGADALRGAGGCRRGCRNSCAATGRSAGPDLQVVLTDAAGMEHTGLIMTPPEDFVITHELAHEWWFGVIGDDQATAPWLDEGFATYAEWKLRRTAPPCRSTGGSGG